MKSPLLVGDIGGTHARFALYEGGVDGNGELHLHRTLSAGAHPTFDQAIRTYLDGVAIDAASLIGGGFAVAAPLDGGVVRFTNSPWSFVGSELQSALKLSRLTVINDFEALALRVPSLSIEERLTLRSGKSEAQAAKLVLGPGTGLGVAGIVSLPSEGGRWR
ncbi:MAG: Glucokinase, partial [Pseudomonadota bacterium]